VAVLDGDDMAVVSSLALGHIPHFTFEPLAVEEAENEYDKKAQKKPEYLEPGPRKLSAEGRAH
jgi:hypothetical protein